MRKSSRSNSEGDKTTRSEIPHCSYFTVDDNMALPNYPMHFPSWNDVMMDIGVEKELNQRGYFDDFYYDGNNARRSINTIRDVELERSRVLLGYVRIYQADYGDITSVFIHIGDNMDPYEVKYPKPLDD